MTEMFHQIQNGVLIEPPAHHRIDFDVCKACRPRIVDTIEDSRSWVIHIIDALKSCIVKRIETDSQTLKPGLLQRGCPT